MYFFKVIMKGNLSQDGFNFKSLLVILELKKNSHLPVMVTSDLDILQEILIKQYANFSARKVNLNYLSGSNCNLN